MYFEDFVYSVLFQDTQTFDINLWKPVNVVSTKYMYAVSLIYLFLCWANKVAILVGI